jgi:SAM-dependent methyltransferase
MTEWERWTTTASALRQVFDAEAARYAASRPTYPPALFDAVATFAGLGPAAAVLEIAAGTGQATRSLAERGWSVTAVELGERMAAEARRHLADLPNAHVVVAPFEDWPLPSEPFDAVLCATARHWLDPATRVAEVAEALRPGGTLAVVSTHHVHGGTSGFFAAAQDCYLRFVPGTDPQFRLPDEARLDPGTDELVASGLFQDVRSEGFPVELTYDAGAFTSLLGTYSNLLTLPQPDLEGLLACLGELIDRRFGGRITMRHLFRLVLARRP